VCWIVGIAVIIALVWGVLQTGKAARAGAANAKRMKWTASTSPVPGPSKAPSAVRTPPQASPALAWYGPDTKISIAGIEIASPCTYVSKNAQAIDPSEILIQRPVTPPVGPTLDLGYWPWYANLSPQQRHGYLRWLASGKAALPGHEGYLFLYYYGLERRLLVDEQDQTWIVREILRLCSLNDSRPDPRQGSSFRGYSTSLLWFMVARYPKGFDAKAFERVCARTTRWSLETATASLAWSTAHEVPVSASMALALARLSSRSVRSVIVDRVQRQFTELFSRRYSEKFGPGIQIHPGGETRQHVYRTASSAIGTVSCTISDPWQTHRDLDSLPELWNSCVEDLRPLSRVDKAATGIMTSESWEALPPELRAGTDHPLQAAMQVLIADVGPEGEESLVPVGRLAALLGFEQRPKLTPTQSRRIAVTAEGTGYCVEPDVRLTGRTYEWNERVAVFLRTEDAPTDPARYNAASCMLRLGLVVALANGSASEIELRTLGEQVGRAFEYPPGEQRRLEALRALLQRQGSDIAHVSKTLERGMSPDARRSIGRLLVAIAAAHDGIDRAELAALRKCFRALGLTAEDLESTIASRAPTSDQSMVMVRAGTAAAAAGEAIPPRADRPKGLQLNQDAINAIMAETKDVARLLADAMRSNDDSSAANGGADDLNLPAQGTERLAASAATATLPPPGQSEAQVPVLAERYRGFYTQLVGKERWARPDADALARQQGLMLTGAIEAINDWAFEVHTTQLIEDEGETLSIDRSLL
jgi:uncharacterized tellurite resistance protein B-like protein